MLCFDRPLTSITFSISLLLLASQIISANAGTTLITTILLTSTASAPPSSPTNPPQYTSPSLFQSSILNSTNFYRTQHNATSLTWNTTLATYAQSYSSSCTFKHSGGPYGENLAEGYANATSSVEASGDERKGYDFAKPGFSEATGHFTQLVWRDTRSTGCGRTFCDGRGGVSGWYVVCEYYPRGNVIGEFATEVDRPLDANDYATCPQGGICSAGSSFRWQNWTALKVWMAIGVVPLLITKGI